jgi:predicted dienelactone hydrolase
LDVSFTIDALAYVTAAAEGTPFDAEEMLPLPDGFTGVPDVTHIGVLGHSYGAYTAQAAAGIELGPTMGIRNFRDPRVDAAVAIAPQGKNRYGSFDKGPHCNSWKDVATPTYLLLGEMDYPEWRRQPFDRYTRGDKFLTVGSGQTHANMAGYDASDAVRKLLDLNTALFFHTYLRGGDSRDSIGTLAWVDGWTLERRFHR